MCVSHDFACVHTCSGASQTRGHSSGQPAQHLPPRTVLLHRQCASPAALCHLHVHPACPWCCHDARTNAQCQWQSRSRVLLMAQCFIRVITGSYPEYDTYPEANVAANQSAYVALSASGVSVPWTTCPQGIQDFKCSSDATNQTCRATL